MYRGLLLDNCQTGRRETVSQDSIEKLRGMGATCVGTLWTGGTQHGREVYERCERALDRPTYIVRVGGHRQTAAEWLAWVDSAVAAACDVPRERLVLVFGNEPNIEGWSDDPYGYGATYARVVGVWSVPVLFACPSVGVAGWREYLDVAVAAAGGVRRGIVNLYGPNVAQAGLFVALLGEAWVGEVNRLPRDEGRAAWLGEAFGELERAGVRGSLVFIAGGRSGGAWDEGYIVTGAEARALGTSTPSTPAPAVPKEGGMQAARIGNIDVADLPGELPDVDGRYAGVNFQEKDFISVHHTASAATASPRTLYDVGVARFGGGISYNFLVYEDGRWVYVGECNTVRAAVGQIAQGNLRGIHVALVGDYTDHDPPAAMLRSAKELIANIQQAYGWWLPVVPHCLFNSGGKWDTECPGSRWREWWPGLLRAVGD